MALLGTRFTMEQSFYIGRMTERFGLDVLTPDATGREIVDRVIYEELVRGVIKADSRRQVQAVIAELATAGAEAVILGCTEIGLLIKPGDSVLPSFDTTELHALAALDWALAD